jgi:transposase
MSGKRRKYTPEFREQAARLVIETGRPVAHVAAEIGVGEQVLGRWVGSPTGGPRNAGSS